MTIADTAIALSNSLTTLATSANPTDAAAALAAAAKLAAGATSWTTAVSEAAADAAELAAATTGLERAFNAVATLAKVNFGAFDPGNVSGVIHRASQLANGATIAEAVSSAGNRYTSARQSAGRVDAATRSLTTQIAQGEALVRYLVA
jgi:hypothetical protein